MAIFMLPFCTDLLKYSIFIENIKGIIAFITLPIIPFLYLKSSLLVL